MDNKVSTGKTIKMSARFIFIILGALIILSILVGRFSVRKPPERKVSTFIVDKELLTGSIQTGRWMLTYTINGVPYVLVFRTERAGLDFIEYLRRVSDLYEPAPELFEETSEIPFTN